MTYRIVIARETGSALPIVAECIAHSTGHVDWRKFEERIRPIIHSIAQRMPQSPGITSSPPIIP